MKPKGNKTCLSFFLYFKCSNTQSEYKALIIGLEIILDTVAPTVLVKGDSLLLLNQLSGEYRCEKILISSFFA